MADVFTPVKRSQVMSRIRGRGNKETELALAQLLRAARITGWRRHVALFGRPDFTFRKKRLVVFVDGCFWHGCPKHLSIPKSNRNFWVNKMARNKTRDRQVTRALRLSGWHVIRIWEHELCKPTQVLRRLTKKLGAHGQTNHLGKLCSADRLRVYKPKLRLTARCPSRVGR